MTDPVVSVASRVLLAMLLASAAWHKLSDFGRFVGTLDGYRLVPKALLKPVAGCIAVIEVVMAAALLFPIYRWAATGVAGLLVLYSGAIAINLARGRREIDCGCFGPAARTQLSASLLVRNVLLVGAAGAAALPLRPRGLTWMDGFSVVALVAATALLWMSFWRLRNASALLGDT